IIHAFHDYTQLGEMNTKKKVKRKIYHFKQKPRCAVGVLILCKFGAVAQMNRATGSYMWVPGLIPGCPLFCTNIAKIVQEINVFCHQNYTLCLSTLVDIFVTSLLINTSCNFLQKDL